MVVKAAAIVVIDVPDSSLAVDVFLGANASRGASFHGLIVGVVLAVGVAK